VAAEGESGADRTEDPTAHRLEEAHRRGDVAKSQELPLFLSLGALTLALLLLPALGSSRTLALDLRSFLMNAHLVPDGGGAFLDYGRRGLEAAAKILVVPVGLVLLAAVGGSLLQHRPVWSLEPLTPKFERLSPLSGIKRLFGAQALVQFLRGILKIVLVGALAAALLWRERDSLEGLVGQDLSALLTFTLGLALKLLGGILALHAVVTAADILWSRFSWLKRQRMTREEVKRESKEQDGNPEIKAKLRQMRVARSRKRMMAAVPTATVVVMNPTHYAVALRYEAGMAAPLCVAKGVDAVALRIRAVAEEHRVTVIENPPLARALHAAVEIDQEIPVEHYKAVAEVIGFVLRLKRRAS
jgi:flagellar biosynthetic protein FlhB